jgi:hypothetical protein
LQRRAPPRRPERGGGPQDWQEPEQQHEAHGAQPPPARQGGRERRGLRRQAHPNEGQGDDSVELDVAHRLQRHQREDDDPESFDRAEGAAMDAHDQREEQAESEGEVGGLVKVGGLEVGDEAHREVVGTGVEEGVAQRFEAERADEGRGEREEAGEEERARWRARALPQPLPELADECEAEQHQADHIAAVQIHPEDHQRGEGPERPGVSPAIVRQQERIGGEQGGGQDLRSPVGDGEGDDQAPQRDQGAADLAKPAQAAGGVGAGHDQRADEAEEEGVTGIAPAALDPGEEDFAQPLVRHPGPTLGGVGEDVGAREGAGVEDMVPGAGVPPVVGVGADEEGGDEGEEGDGQGQRRSLEGDLRRDFAPPPTGNARRLGLRRHTLLHPPGNRRQAPAIIGTPPSA